MIKRILTAVLAALLVVTVIGCMEKSKESGNAESSNSMIPLDIDGDLMKDITPTAVHKVTLDSSATDPMSEFTINLFKKTAKPGENSLVSPLSVYIALAMTSNGASGNTLKEFEALLGAKRDTYNSAVKTYMDELSAKRGGTTFEIANSIWYHKTFSPYADFIQANADYYGSGARKLDFTDKASKDIINSWASEKTHGFIKEAVSEIKKDHIMFLVNTLFFDAKWKSVFNAQANQELDFTAGDGTVKKVTFMNQRNNYDVLESDGAKGIILPYDDNRYSFAAVLPKEGTKLSDYIASLTAKKLSTLLASKEMADAMVWLPKFETEFEAKDIIEILKNMGLKDAFDALNADFSKMGDVSDGNIYIGTVEHKTHIIVSEDGTKAGAATAIGMEKTSLPPTYKFDRPFVYMILDNQTNLPVFIGTTEKL